jgi:hypothetical protein
MKSITEIVQNLGELKKTINPFSDEMLIYIQDDKGTLHKATIIINMDCMQVEIRKQGLGDLF